ncbi:hypothetical protein NP493_550g03022 [Ridgeia piscesae]|uniref:5'-nucleotidase n=1 Tax=Ridgeia piscesae TaxID=27915 RepID=A0AAD9KVN3_RIDPI|nr:hypothetical protein NP493_550g03022 [Ridgeia piscesae]
MADSRVCARSPLSSLRRYAHCLVAALWLFSWFAVADASFNLTLLHTNDVHAHFEQSNAYNSPCTAKDAARGRCYGGVARRYTKVEEIRRSHDNVLLLDAGDEFQGTVWFFFYKGSVASHFMNRLHYNAMTLGNHEFDAGVGSLTSQRTWSMCKILFADTRQPRVRCWGRFFDVTTYLTLGNHEFDAGVGSLTTFLHNLTFPVVSANIDASKEPTLAACFTKSTILNVTGEMIGIVGYTTPDTKATSNQVNVKRIDFLDPIGSIQNEVDKLITQNINKIVVLGHGGYLLDQKIAKEVKGIDIVIGGHSHTFLYSGTPPGREKPKGDYPTVVKQDSGDEVLVVQAFAYGKYLGFLQLEFDDVGKVTSWAGQPIVLDKSVEQDPDILAELETYKAPLQTFKARTLGKRRSGGRRHVPGEGVLPGDSLMAVDLEGRYIIQMLEHSVVDYDPTAVKGKFLQMSGNLLSDTLVVYLRRRSTIVQGLDDNIVFRSSPKLVIDPGPTQKPLPTRNPGRAIITQRSAATRGHACLLLLVCALVFQIA